MIKFQRFWILALLSGLIFFQSCDDDDDATPAEEPSTENQVFQLAINEAKAGERGNFLSTRAAFIDRLNAQSGVQNDNAWRPFFTTLPNLDVDNILVGMTEYQSETAMQQTFAALAPQDVFTNYTQTFNSLASVGLKTLDGEDFDFSTVTQNGQVVEVAIRKGLNDDSFGEARTAFFESLKNYDGFLFDREFEVYNIGQSGELTKREDYQAVIIVWENQEKFFAATTPIFASAEFAAFSQGIEVETYFATQLADLSQNNDVFELAIRRINSGTSIQAFTSARDSFVAVLASQPGAFHDREVQPFVDLRGSGLALDSVYIGMTQYENIETYLALAQSLASTPQANAFISTFSPLVFEALQPIEGYGPVDLATVAPLGTDRVLEIAVRDLSVYENFDQADYEAKRDAFIELLSQQEGFIQEIQWTSAINEGIAVGMTVYESQEAVFAINSDTTFTNSSAVTDFISAYPPSEFGTVNTVLK